MPYTQLELYAVKSSVERFTCCIAQSGSLLYILAQLQAASMSAKMLLISSLQFRNHATSSVASYYEVPKLFVISECSCFVKFVTAPASWIRNPCPIRAELYSKPETTVSPRVRGLSSIMFS